MFWDKKHNKIVLLLCFFVKIKKSTTKIQFHCVLG